MTQRRIILYPGSFNPIHNGHLSVAEMALQMTEADEVWFVVSPHNPFKEEGTLAPEKDRLAMVELAIREQRKEKVFSACDIEFSLPKPSFTVNTLRGLSQTHPGDHFSLLIGSDNVDDFIRWKEYAYILEHYPVWVYPRKDHLPRQGEIPQFRWLEDVPLLPQASTAIREEIVEGHPPQEDLPRAVWNYIKTHKLYGREH